METSVYIGTTRDGLRVEVAESVYARQLLVDPSSISWPLHQWQEFLLAQVQADASEVPAPVAEPAVQTEPAAPETAAEALDPTPVKEEVTTKDEAVASFSVPTTEQSDEPIVEVDGWHPRV